MSIRSLLLVAALLPLAACGSEPAVDAENATAGEVAAQVAAAGAEGAFVSPGKWRTRITIEDITLAGMPPEMAAQMKQQMSAAGTTTAETCLTEADVSKPGPGFFGNDDKSCKFERFTMAGGKIDVQMTCGEAGASQSMAMQGTYSADAYSISAHSKGKMQDAGPEMDMKTRIDAERIGECAA